MQQNWLNIALLDALAELQKATTSFVMSVRRSVRLEQLGCHWEEFREIWYLSIFRKSLEKLKFNYMNSYLSLWYFAELFLEWDIFQTKVVGRK